MDTHTRLLRFGRECECQAAARDEGRGAGARVPGQGQGALTSLVQRAWLQLRQLRLAPEDRQVEAAWQCCDTGTCTHTAELCSLPTRCSLAEILVHQLVGRVILHSAGADGAGQY